MQLPGEDLVTLIVPIADTPGEFLIGHGRDIVHIKWDTKDNTLNATPLVTVDTHEPNNRFNDGKCDPRGRLWAGTMPIEDQARPGEWLLNKGALYRIDARGAAKMLDQVKTGTALFVRHDISRPVCFEFR